jgi:pilus assembly protein Flp/PilA
MGCLSLLLGSAAEKAARNETVRRLMEETSGVTAIEYGLIAALIAIAAIAAFTAVGTSLSSTFSYIATQL